jgi:hypothetical protein
MRRRQRLKSARQLSTIGLSRPFLLDPQIEVHPPATAPQAQDRLCIIHGRAQYELLRSVIQDQVHGDSLRRPALYFGPGHLDVGDLSPRSAARSVVRAVPSTVTSRG